MKNIILFTLSIIILAACTKSFDGGYEPPLLYKVDIQQGNVIEQDMLDRLKPGMNKNQVKFILGTPVIVDPFHNNRWEYVYSFQEGGGIREQRHFTAHFEDDKLTRITGDIVPADGSRDGNQIVEAEAVVVPKSYKKKKGFFGRLFDSVNPFGDDKTKPVSDDKVEAPEANKTEPSETNKTTP